MTAQNFKKLLVETVGPMFEELKYGMHRLEKRVTNLEHKVDEKIGEINTKLDMALDQCQVIPKHETRLTNLEKNMNVIKLVIKRPKN